MRTVGIIVEYNPLHNGHVYHNQQARIVSNADAVVAVMSGHFLQRGEPALVNKWARTEMALRMGADLVIELPVAFSSQPAEWFAYGAVSALQASGVVDSICFGSESGDIRWLSRLASLLAEEPARFQNLLANRLKEGMNYPAAYSMAIQDYLALQPDDKHPASGLSLTSTDHDYVLNRPNDTLGLHYLIALQRLDCRSITPFTIKRIAADYRDEHISDSHIASATAIRRTLSEEGDLARVKPYVPSYTIDIIEREYAAGRAPIDWESFSDRLFHSLLQRSREELSEIADMTEGLENRMLKSLSEMNDEWSVNRFIELCKTKRYTRTRLQRAMTRLLLGHRKDVLTRDVLSAGVPYLRVLGFNRTGRTLLKRMQKTATVPVITNVGRNVHPMLELDIRATGIYALAYRSHSSRDILRDYYEPPIYYEPATQK